MIDLHIHTKYSDGTYTVPQVLAEAQKIGLSAISITDHNCVDAYEEIKNTSEVYTGKIITGAEFDCVFDNIKIELLGYNFDYKTVKRWFYTMHSRKNEKLLEEYNYAKDMCKSIGIKIADEYEYDPHNEYPLDAIYKQIIKFDENMKFISMPGMENANDFFRNVTTNKYFFCIWTSQSF